MVKKITKNEVLSINFDQELKKEMATAAQQRGMEMSQLARIVLVNYLRPGTYQL